MEEELLSFYKSEGRKLPWRKKDVSFYEVLVSETMLQQTRVEKVLSYYDRFLRKFPSLEKLARAKEEEVLKLWEGLGYYSRARNLLKAARMLSSLTSLPETKEELLSVPGIGEYTSKSILALFFHKREFAVDGNLLRVHSRLTKDDRSLATRKKNAELYFQEHLRKGDPSDLNQALMDLGELICLPNGMPRCALCPFKEDCLAHKGHVETLYPKKERKQQRKEEKRTVFLFFLDGRYVLRKRKEKGLLHNLYEFPNVKQTFRDEGSLKKYLSQEGIHFQRVEFLAKSAHVFSHLLWKMDNVEVILRQEAKDKDWIYVTREELENYAIPSAFQAIKKKIES